MRVYLLDANGLSHWLWHEADNDAAGNETQLGERVTKWWREFCETMHPTHFVACFDGAKNWRKSVFAEYKANRLAKPPDEGKLAALRTIPGLWRSLGVKTITCETFEADDVIAALAAKWSFDAEIITIATDKDMLQLVEQHGARWPLQYDPRPNKAGECVFYSATSVEEKMGVSPHRIAELLAIMGDAADNVPGIKGIGKVQATVAIRQTKTAAEMFRKAAKGELANITAANQAKIVAGREDFELSLKLVTLRYDAPIDLTIDDAAIAPWFPRVDEQLIADGARIAEEKS